MFALLFALIPAVAMSVPAAAETRIALVIGINAYQNAPALSNPVNDAEAVSDALRRLNFEVEEAHDADFRTLSRAVRDFGIRAQGADAALVYYAGHGVQVDRENYLIPADAKLERARDLAYEALPLSLLLDEVSQASKIGIVLLDSCRNNPFIDRVARAMSVVGRAVATTPGMARVDNVPRNTMVVMAAKADQIAEDGREHSPFAAAILAHFQIPGLELGLFVRSVRDAVLRATQNRQEPYVFSSLGAEPFYFFPRPPNRPPLIGPMATLQLLDTSGPTPLGIPAPTDPDLDPLTVRIIGLPRGGEVRVRGRKAALGEAFSVDQFMTGTFKPDGTMFGATGTLDLLVEDGRGGSATGSLPVVVISTSTASPTAVQAPALTAADMAAGKPAGGKPTGPALSLPASPAVPGADAASTPAATTAPASMLSLVVPPVPGPSSAATSSDPALRLAEVRALALGVPCALIDVREPERSGQPPSLLVSGPTLPGAAFDSFVRQVEARAGSVGIATEPLDPSHCAALAVITDLVRRSRKQGKLRLTVPAAPVAVGAQLVVAAEAIPRGSLYVDMYAADGSVLHLRRGPVSETPAENDVTIAAAASGPPGQRLLVVITAAVPLPDLTKRPANESEAAYLPALQRELARLSSSAVEPRAEVATLSIIPAPRTDIVGQRTSTHPSATNRPPPSTHPRCQDIVARVMLGETLSDADRTILRTNCGR